MSRAFVREEDIDRAEDVQERPISEHRNLVTPSGLAKIDGEIARLRDMHEAAASDHERVHIARDLRYWLARRETAEPVAATKDASHVRFGHAVVLQDGDGGEKSYRIVGEDEADPAAGLLFYKAPLAQAMIGKKQGEAVEFRGFHYQIKHIGF